MFPYGYGGLRYITSLLSGMSIFFVGGGVNIYHGASGLLHPGTLEPLTYVRLFIFGQSLLHLQAYYALACSFLFQFISLSRAFMTIRKRSSEKNISVWQYSSFLNLLNLFSFIFQLGTGAIHPSMLFCWKIARH